MFSLKEDTLEKMKERSINDCTNYFYENNDSSNAFTGASISQGLDFVGNGSSSSLMSSILNPSYDTSDHVTVNPRYRDTGHVKNNLNEEYWPNVPYQLGLFENLENLERINNGGEQKNYTNAASQVRATPDGDFLGLNHPLSTCVQGFNEDIFYGYNTVGGYNRVRGCEVNDSMGLRLGCNVNDLTAALSLSSRRHSGSLPLDRGALPPPLYSEQHQRRALPLSLYSEHQHQPLPLYNELQHQIDRYTMLIKEQEKDHYNRDVQVQTPFGVNAVDMPRINDGFYNTQQYGHFFYDTGLLTSQSLKAQAELNMECKPLKQKPREFSDDGINLHSRRRPPPTATAEELGAFSYEDTFIVDEEHQTFGFNIKFNRSKVSKKKHNESSEEKVLVPGFIWRNVQSSNGEKHNESSEEKVPVPDFMLRDVQSSNREGEGEGDVNGLQQANSSTAPLFCSLADLRGYIYVISKDQFGCRFLQRVFDEENREDMKLIFTEILPHIVELMMDPFGNYLIQKLLDFCTEEQIFQILLMLTKRRGQLVSICFNSHGTRVVQKLIQAMKSSQQISLLMVALKPGMVELMKDINGNHVVQRCLEHLSNEDSKFIFDAATRFCVEIASDSHGCCVLNRCVAYSNGKYRERLVRSISANGLFLAQDAYGNYVIQNIIEHKIPNVAATLLSLFEGHYAYLSMQKFSSHVVEKCLRSLEESRSRIIQELISMPHFDQLLQDRFANYVIQSALDVSKGSLRSRLVEALRPYQSLRTNPYCKKIFSRNLFKK